MSNFIFTYTLTIVNNDMYFAAADGSGGSEMWKSDGTGAGTTPVVDLETAPHNLTPFNGLLYFSLDNALWESDGTSLGTASVKDNLAFPIPSPKIFFGGPAATDAAFVNADGLLFFAASDGLHGLELWTSGGTPASTLMVKDINAITDDSNPSEFTAAGGLTYFTADDGVHGQALWQTDGTTAGTSLVIDSNGDVLSNPSYLTNVSGTLYFVADDQGATPDLGPQLWETTPAGARSGRRPRPHCLSDRSHRRRQWHALFPGQRRAMGFRRHARVPTDEQQPGPARGSRPGRQHEWDHLLLHL